MKGTGGAGPTRDKEPILTAASSPRPEPSHMALTERDGCAAQGMDGRMEEGETDGGWGGYSWNKAQPVLWCYQVTF